jgi:hypothetical protein
MNKNNKNNNYWAILGLTVLMLMPLESQAAGMSAGVDAMFANFRDSSVALTRLIKYISYIIGLFFVINSIHKFSQLGSNQQLTPKVPITMFFVGVSIFSLTSVVNLAPATMAMGAGPGTILMPSGPAFGAVTAAGLQGVFLFIRLVGYIAFIRGFLLLNQAGQGKDGTVGRGLTHIFGGVAAINITITAKILANTLAPGMVLPI